jgi:3-carboxy-cis,cis-muconate cycloisomerase
LGLLGPLFRWEAVELHLSDRARIQGMLDFEAALARAEAGAGVIPASAAPAIVRCCAAERFDEGALAHATARAGNPAIPLVQQLTALVEKDDPGAARFVHWGATSQDAMDTGFVLQLREALGAIETELDRLADVLATLADRHPGTPLAGRTWMQQAAPTTFGLKAAGWLDAVERHRVRLRDLRARRDVLADDAEASRHLSREELASLFEPRLYLGVSDRLIERVLAGRRSDGPAGSGGS